VNFSDVQKMISAIEGKGRRPVRILAKPIQGRRHNSARIEPSLTVAVLIPQINIPFSVKKGLIL
jgi:hypothetical protein